MSKNKNKKTKLELTFIWKEERPWIEPRIHWDGKK
jgi:hypothetical protein